MFGPLRRSLAAKLAAGYLVTVAGVTAVVGVGLVRQVESHALHQLESALATQAQLMAHALPDGPLTAADRTALQPRAAAWAAQAGCRVTLIAADGTVVADSDVPEPQLPAMENHRGRPEVEAALGGRAGQAIRRSATVRRPLLYVAVPIVHAGATAGVLRVALPVTQVHTLLWTVGRTLAVGLGLTALLIVLASLVIAWRITRPLGAIAQSARALAEGALHTRARVRSADELGQVGDAFNTMADQLERKIQELETSRGQIEGILHGMTEGVLAVGPDERLLLINAAARAIGGMDPALGPGAPLVEALRDPELQRMVRAVLQSGAPRVQDLTLYTPAERHLTVHATSCPCAPTGRGALLVLHDVTERKRLEEVRRDFVANVSHELKTPLTAIQGAVETLLDGALSDAGHARPFVASIAEEAARLRRLVDDLLTLAQVEQPHAAPGREPIALEAFLATEVARHRPLAEARQVALTLGAVPPVTLQADRRQLAQAVGNLLDNAIQYNRPGGRVVVRAREAAGQLRIEVEDTGLGIPPDDLPRIFERFYRVDKGRSRETGGTGLGLSIVKHVAEAHGGTVSVESRVEHGSCFTLQLPR